MYCREIKVMGSSPLARGLPSTWEVPLKVVGIIPARAGSTDSFSDR